MENGLPFRETTSLFAIIVYKIITLEKYLYLKTGSVFFTG